MKKQTAAAIAVAAAVGTTGLTWAAPASADLTTRCVGEGGAVTVPGDLVVPAGQSCTLTGTTVEGDVRVARDANLVADDATFESRVIVQRNAYFEAAGSSVAGQVVMNSAYGSYLDDTRLDDRILTRPGVDSEVAGFVYTYQADLTDSVVSRSGEIFLESSEVGGSLRSVGSLYTDVYASFVDGDLVVRDNELGSVICSTAVQGTGRFLDNAEIIQLGSDGPFTDCAGGSYWAGDVVANGTDGEVYVDNNIVNGDVTLRANDPVAAVGAGNLIRGEIQGEFTDWDGSAAMGLQRQAPSSADQRADTLERKVDARHAEAEADAAAAGKAAL